MTPINQPARSRLCCTDWRLLLTSRSPDCSYQRILDDLPPSNNRMYVFEIEEICMKPIVCATYGSDPEGRKSDGVMDRDQRSECRFGAGSPSVDARVRVRSRKGVKKECRCREKLRYVQRPFEDVRGSAAGEQ